MSSYRDWILLSKLPYLGPRTCRQLVEHLGSPEKVLSASPQVLSRIPGLKGKAVSSITHQIDRIEIDRDLKRIEELGIEVINFKDPRYPVNLKTIFDPPFLLYVSGRLEKQDLDALAIVGTRRLARDLAREGVTVVSGMARGIDTEAHRGALEAGGRTMAVLGCGVDIVYPPENRGLMEEIIKKGAVISEFSLGEEPEAPHFPQRNRIISGLSKGVLVVEAPLKSGALITANFALDQGRDVFAVPGNINSPNSHGTNGLIKEGAKLVESMEDVLEELNFSELAQLKKEKIKDKNLSLFPEEKEIFNRLKDEPSHIDLLVELSRFPASKVGELLMRLQIKSLVRELPGKLFCKI
ncbi:MAG: DNA-protecting protein DprA [Firmicutes bacterium]|nr:DNA-protecting protein DprA [Bacillota bacterium]